MTVSKDTETFVADVEESGVAKLVAYWDGYHAWTIGYGHTGPEVVKGFTCTQAQADAWLTEDLQASQDNVLRVVKVPLNANQLTVLTSFDFNEGDGALDASTLLKRLNDGDYAGVVPELARWVYAEQNGKMVYSAGLAARRTREAALWQTASTIASVPGVEPPMPPDVPPIEPVPAPQDPDNEKPPLPPLWSSTTIISAVGTVLGAGGAGWLGQINNLYALGAIVVVAVFAYLIITRRVQQRKVSGS